MPAKSPFYTSLKTSLPFISKLIAVFVINDADILKMTEIMEVIEVNVSFLVELSP